MDMCLELAELGMALARAVARKALRDIEAQEDAPAAETPEHAPRTADPALVFARLSSAVCQAMALRARLAAGPETPRTRPPADPRRAVLLGVFDATIKNYPARPDLRREIAEQIDQELATDPESLVCMGDTLGIVGHKLQVRLDLSQITDEVLASLRPRPAAPDPKATSPPYG